MADKLQQGKFDSFTIVNNGLIETDLLTDHEKMVYIVIRKRLNQKNRQHSQEWLLLQGKREAVNHKY